MMEVGNNDRNYYEEQSNEMKEMTTQVLTIFRHLRFVLAFDCSDFSLLMIRDTQIYQG